MKKDLANWHIRYGGWLLMAILLPLQFWPASWWFVVNEVHIRDARVGEPIPMTIDREVRRPFRGQWSTTIRQWDGSGWTTWCNASGGSNYTPEARFPKNLALQWWTDGYCHPLPAGRYRVTTSWVITNLSMVADRSLSVDSNIFEIRP